MSIAEVLKYLEDVNSYMDRQAGNKKEAVINPTGIHEDAGSIPALT